jgi:phytoene dehydrogenase-like protein
MFDVAGRAYLNTPFEGFASYARQSAPTFNPIVGLQLLVQTLADFSASHFETPELQQFASRFATYVGTTPYVGSPALAMIAHVERAFGVHHVVGGMRSIVNALADACRAHGATVQLNAPVSLAGSPRVPAGFGTWDAVIVNADPIGEADDRELGLSGYVMILDSARADLPHHRVHFSADYRGEFNEIARGEAPSDPTIYLCHPAATDASAAPTGRSGVFVMINMPARAPFASDTLAAVRERVLKKVIACEPALAGARVVFERTPNDFQAIGAPRGSIYGHLERGAFGPFKRPRMRGKVPGTFYCGGGTHPGGGVPMVLSSGRFAAAMAASFVERA